MKILKSLRDKYVYGTAHRDTGSFNAYGTTISSGYPVITPNDTRNVDKIPSWMARCDKDSKIHVSFNNTNIPSNQQRKKGRMWVFSAQILTTPANTMNPHMPLDVDNALPGIELWFSKDLSSEIGLLCHLDTCTAMNTGNLQLNQWVMTTYPYLVTEYIQYADCNPFQPLQL